MDERKTGQSSGGGNKGKLPALLALVSVVLFLALVGGRIREMVSEKELVSTAESEALLEETEEMGFDLADEEKIDDVIDEAESFPDKEELPEEKLPEEEPPDSGFIRIVLWDRGAAVHEYRLKAETGSEIQIPGIPDDLRHTDEVFSCFNTRKDLTGKTIFPGTWVIVKQDTINLYLVWEPALINNADERLIQTRTFVQAYEKTKWTPKSYSIQGGTLAERGGRRYWIQAMANTVQESETDSKGVPEAGNYTALFIYDFDTGEVVNYSTSIPFGHGNDLEYNPYYDTIVICSAFMNDNTITLVDWDLQNYRCFIPGGCEWFRVASCPFDADQGLYFLTLTPETINSLSKSLYVMRYDQGWSWKGTYEQPFASPYNHYGIQGACIHNGYYYLANYLQQNLRENGKISYKCGRLSVYDVYRFTYMGSIPINVPDEIEDVTVIGRTAYLNGQIYRDPNDKLRKFNIYEVDLGDLEFMLDITRGMPAPESMASIRAGLMASPEPGSSSRDEGTDEK